MTYVCNECPNKKCYKDYPFNEKIYKTCPHMKGMHYSFKEVEDDGPTKEKGDAQEGP